MQYDAATRTFSFYWESASQVGEHEYGVKATLNQYPLRFEEMSATLTVMETDLCAAPASITPSFMSPQEYIITFPAETYQFDPFVTDPPDCPVTYTYLVSPPSAADVITFDAATRTFTFFNDQDVSIAMPNPYGILITGTAGSVTPVEVRTIPPLLLTV